MLNCLPTKVLNGLSPYELLYCKKFDMSYLRVFDSPCFPCLRSYNKTKLEPRFQECVFLGYASKQRGYVGVQWGMLSLSGFRD